MGGAGEVLSPFRKGMYDCKEFSVIDVVIPFSGSEYFREVHARVQVAISVFLHEDPPRGSEGGIRHDKEGFGVIGERENRLL